MDEKLQKMFFVFEIIVCELIGVNSRIFDENTCDLQ